MGHEAVEGNGTDKQQQGDSSSPSADDDLGVAVKEKPVVDSGEEFFEAEAGGEQEFGELPTELTEGLTPAQRDPIKAKEMKEAGNKLYQAKEYEEAYEYYTRAIQFCPYQYQEEDVAAMRRKMMMEEEEDAGAAAAAASAGAAGGPAAGGGEEENDQKKKKEEEEAEVAKIDEPFAEHKEDLAVYYCNRAACTVNLRRDKQTVEDCTKAIKLKPNYVKAILRRAQAFERLDKLEDALRDYRKVVELDPSCRQAREKIPGLERVVAERMEKLKTETLGKLKELGNSVLGNFGLSLDNFKMNQDPNTGSYSISFSK